MTKTCKITIVDQVNVLITGISDQIKKKLNERLRWRHKSYFHSPKYKLGVWDGYINLFKNGWTYLNLLDDDIIDLIGNYGYDFEIVDQRNAEPHDIEPIDKDLFADYLWDHGKPVEIRDYQVHAVNEIVDNPCGIFVMGTGAGKTLTTAAIAERFSDGKVIMIVPTIDLVQQTAKSFRKVGLNVGEFYSEEKIVEDVTISTWQSLMNYPEILEGCDCVIADECHEYTAREVFDLLTVAAKEVPHRYGFTGTLPKDDLGLNQLRAALGPVLFEKAAWELQQEGYLAECHINIIQTVEEVTDFGKNSYKKEETVLLNNEPRTKFIADMITDIAETGNTLVLVKYTKYGERLEGLIPDSVFMAGSGKNKVKSEDRHVEYAKMNEEDNQVIICTYGIASTGIDIPRIFNLVIIDAGNSFTKVIQSIGRSLRRASDKDFAYIYDVCANTKYSNRQKNNRIKYYKEAKYPYSMEKVKYEVSD